APAPCVAAGSSWSAADGRRSTRWGTTTTGSAPAPAPPPTRKRSGSGGRPRRIGGPRSGPTTGPSATGPGSSTPARAERPASTTGRSPTPAPATSPATGAPASSSSSRRRSDEPGPTGPPLGRRCCRPARRRDDGHPGLHLLRRPRHQELRRDRPRVVPLLPPPRPPRRAPLRVRAPLGHPAPPQPGGAVTTPASRARRWAAISFGVGIGLVVGSLFAALLVIAHDPVVDLNVRTGAEVQR